MKRAIVSLLLSVFIALPLAAQGQRGVVVIQNSGKKVLPQVAIVIAGASPTTSDVEGKFSVPLPNHQKGQRLLIQEISYKDYVIVNSHMVHQWVYAPDKVYRVDMCPKHEYESRVEQFYQIGRNNSQAKYNQVIEELKQLKEQGLVSDKDYVERREQAQRSLRKVQELLDVYVPLLVAINVDYLEPIERKAQQLVEEGRMEEAIRLYEGLQLEKKLEHDLKLKKEWDDDIEALIPPIERFSQTLILQGGEDNYNRAGGLLKMMADSDPKHVERNAAYALFANQQNNYTEAESYYNRTIAHTKSPYDLADWYIRLAGVYDDSNKMSECFAAYEKAADILDSLPRQVVATAELTMILNINMSGVITKVVRYASEEVKQNGYKTALKCLDAAVKLLEEFGSIISDDYRKQLMLCYNNMTSIYGMQKDMNGLKRIQRKIDQLGLSVTDDVSLMNLWVSKGTAAIHAKKNVEAIEHLLKAHEVTEKIYRSNPHRYKEERIQVFSLLGCAYYDANQYDNAITYLSEGLELFHTFTPEDQVSHENLVYDLYHNLLNSYSYHKQHNEVFATFKEFRPYMGKDLESDIRIWTVVLQAAYYLGAYEILDDEKEIRDVLKAYTNHETLYPNVEACYGFLATLHLNVGNIRTCEELFKLSDQCAELHRHKRQLAYNLLNSLGLSNMIHQPEKTLLTAPRVEASLKKEKGDEESFFILTQCRFMAYMMMKQLDKADQIFSQMEQMAPQNPTKEKCQALFAYAVLCRENGKPTKEYSDRFLKEAEEVKKISLFHYLELMTDYYLVQAHYAAKSQNNILALNCISKALDFQSKLGNESPLRLPFILSYTMNKYGDLILSQKDFKGAMEAYEGAITTFYSYHSEQQKECYTHMYDWNAALLLDKDMLQFEQEVRKIGDARSGMLQQAFALSLHLLQTDPEGGVPFVSYLKNRRMPELNEFYKPGLLALCKQLDGKMASNYQPAITKLMNLLHE